VSSKFRQPTGQQLEGFIKGDPDSIDEVIRLLLPQLQGWALKAYFNLPQDDVKSVVNRVLAEACLRHSFYNPLKAKLTTYLARLISKRIIDLYKTTKRGAEHHESFSAPPPELERGLLYAAEIDTRIMRARFFESVKERLNEAERVVLELLRQGEDSKELLSSVLQRHQSLTGSEFCVKNFRGRLIKKVRVIAGKQGYNNRDLLDVRARQVRSPYL
jgi:DNA-directed RNA polymerase specialized sigma24 family protein